MRNIVFMLLIATTLCSAQNTPIDGFWGMKFGTSSKEVKSVMMQKKGCEQIHEADQNVITFKGVEFAGENPKRISFIFFEDKLSVVIVTIKPNDDSDVFKLYEELRSTIILKYGDAYNTIEQFKSPFQHGDDLELLALKSGKLEISTTWWGMDILTDGKKSVGKTITISASKHVEIDIIYADMVLASKINDAEKEQNSNDF